MIKRNEWTVGKLGGGVLALSGAFVVLGCGGSTGSTCGSGTHDVDGVCVVDGTGGTGGSGGSTGGMVCGTDTEDDGSGTCVAVTPPLIVPTAADMVSYACDDTGLCDSADVIYYWDKLIKNDLAYDGSTWNDHAVRRTVTFADDGDPDYSAATYGLNVTDTVTGAAATLSFDVGVPVILRLVNPSSGATKKHYLTAPIFYRSVAWRKADTADAEYKAPHFDAFELLYNGTTDHAIDLYFVPIEAGAYDTYCQIDVTNGGSYTGIVDGSVNLNLAASGHSRAGMETTVTVNDPDLLNLTVFQGQLPRPNSGIGTNGSLDDDPRRSDKSVEGTPLWTKGADGISCTADDRVVCQTITFLEDSTGVASGFGDAQENSVSAISLEAGVGHILKLVNPGGNQSKHYFTAPDFYKDSVMRKAQDSQAEIKASYFNAVEVKVNSAVGGADTSTEVYLIPTVVTSYAPYCQIGVDHSGGGAPDMTTGHAGDGMTMTIDVTPHLIVPEAADMVSYACDAAGLCMSADVIYFWDKAIKKDPYDGSTWNDHAVQTTVTFLDDGDSNYGTATYSFDVTDTVTGAAATLDFEVGIPVILTLVNPSTGATKKHYFTSPEFYRSVAWRKADTADAEYKAPNFDAFELLWDGADDHSIKLYFVPIVAGAYDAYCQIDVVDGGSYTDILNGNVTLNLPASGHSMAGMVDVVNVTDPDSLNLSLFQEELLRPNSGLGTGGALDDDPRRSDKSTEGLVLWAKDTSGGGYCVGDSPVECTTITFDETSGTPSGFTPSTVALTQNVGNIVTLVNPKGNQSKHYLTAADFYKDCVMRKAQDSQAEIKASYLNAVEVKVDSNPSGNDTTTDLYLVPTVEASYTPYCQINVAHGSNGTPDLSSGHAGDGMMMTLDVAP